YDVVQKKDGSSLETRFFYEGKQHFMSTITSAGAISIRAHPGNDVNGWGTSWYEQPFLPGAVLKNTVVDKIVAGKDGVDVYAHGKVSQGKSSNYGVWNSFNHFSFNPLEKKVSGTGTYDITLSRPLNLASGDLNLFKIASNHLESVPLLSGGNGSTGDMMTADVTLDTDAFTWNPETQPSHFPGPQTDNLSINMDPTYNNVDTAAQGYAPIAAAYKPGVRIALNSRNPDANMIFGGIYNASQSKQFWSDNIGITPLVLKDNPNQLYSFDVTFESVADPLG
ncbi:MAG: hypothetical protein WCP89_04295, partial [archaeon]